MFGWDVGRGRGWTSLTSGAVECPCSSLYSSFPFLDVMMRLRAVAVDGSGLRLLCVRVLVGCVRVLKDIQIW